MLVRMLAGTIAGCFSLIVGCTVALANPDAMTDPDDRLSGGAPLGKRYSIFGTSPVPRSTVGYPGKEKPGTIIINTAERRLYYRARRRPRDPLRHRRRPRRLHLERRATVTNKREWPDWTPPPADAQAPGPTCRATCRAARTIRSARARMYLGSTLYRIHGSNEPETIGRPIRPAASA